MHFEAQIMDLRHPDNGKVMASQKRTVRFTVHDTKSLLTPQDRPGPVQYLHDVVLRYHITSDGISVWIADDHPAWFACDWSYAAIRDALKTRNQEIRFAAHYEP